MAMATVVHHSFGPVHTECGSPRGQKTATMALREVWDEMYDAIGQKTPPSAAFFRVFDDEQGVRPPCLDEPPGRLDRIQRGTCSIDEDFLILVPVLGVSSAAEEERARGFLQGDHCGARGCQLLGVPKTFLPTLAPSRSTPQAPQVAEKMAGDTNSSCQGNIGSIFVGCCSVTWRGSHLSSVSIAVLGVKEALPIKVANSHFSFSGGKYRDILFSFRKALHQVEGFSRVVGTHHLKCQRVPDTEIFATLQTWSEFAPRIFQGLEGDLFFTACSSRPRGALHQMEVPIFFGWFIS